MNLLDPLAPFKLTKDLLKLALANNTNPSDIDTYERDSASIHTAHRGDVLGIKRVDIIDYKHFAIYLGNSSVIHYALDSSGKITIH